MSEPLPSGWTSCALKELVGDGVFADGDWVESKDQDPNGAIRLIQLADVGLGRFINKSSRFLTEAKAKELGCTFLESGDVLISRMADPIGRACIFPGVSQRCVTVVDICIVRPATERADAQWLVSAINSPQFRGAIELAASGTTRSRVSRGNLGTLELPVPPLNEQRRIVAKLEALQARSRRAREALDAVPPLLEKLRQSILAAAFRGDLTKDWRAKNKNVEPATKLLARIRTERRKKWEESELAKMKAKGKPPTDNKWKATYKEPDPVNPAGLPELPEGWCWARAEEVCAFITKGTTPSAENLASSGDVPFIKVYNLTFHGVVDFSIDPTFVDQATHASALARSRVVPGDVLMNIVGPPLGKVGIVPDTFPEWNMNQAIAVFRGLAGLSRDYLAFHLLSSRTVQWAVQEGKATAGQLNLTLEICRDLPIPLCPEAEQATVVATLNEAMAIARRLALAAEATLARCGQLERAVLAKAFRGELVPQDPTDEPAEVMLARLRPQRATDDGPPVSAKRTTARKRKAG